MGNCLKIQLKAVVNNPDLPIYNAIVVDVKEVANPTADTQWVIVQGEGVSIEVPLEYPMTDSQHFANGTYKAIIRNKYAISGNLALGASSALDINQLNGCAGITSIEGTAAKRGNIKSLSLLTNLTKATLKDSPELTGDISVFANMPNLTNVDISKTGVQGDIACFSTLTGITNLKLSLSPGITGNIESLGNLTQLTTIPVVHGTNIHGSFDEFVSRQVTAGRNTYAAGIGGSVAGLLNNCTFGGKKRTSGNEWTWPSWDGANKVVVYVGANNYQNCLTIYEKGATAEEIAAWNAAGKTVTDVLTDTVYPPTN